MSDRPYNCSKCFEPMEEPGLCACCDPPSMVREDVALRDVSDEEAKAALQVLNGYTFDMSKGAGPRWMARALNAFLAGRRGKG